LGEGTRKRITKRNFWDVRGIIGKGKIRRRVIALLKGKKDGQVK